MIKKENHGKTTEKSQMLKWFTYFQAALYMQITHALGTDAPPYWMVF